LLNLKSGQSLTTLVAIFGVGLHLSAANDCTLGIWLGASISSALAADWPNDLGVELDAIIHSRRKKTESASILHRHPNLYQMSFIFVSGFQPPGFAHFNGQFSVGIGEQFR
jgi:hypothetical protein